MSNFIFKETPLQGLYEIEQKIFEDDRGYFLESYNYQQFKQGGLDLIFVQDNQSSSKKGVLRGLHFQKKNSQGKLIRALKGEIYDVAVDLRTNSCTFGKWYGVILSDKNKKQFYMLPGFAHGFFVISERAEIAYKCTDYYHPEDECGIIWSDTDLAIDWPIMDKDSIILSEKDKNWMTFKDYKKVSI